MMELALVNAHELMPTLGVGRSSWGKRGEGGSDGPRDEVFPKVVTFNR